jgi:hypothetical protein
MTAIATVTGRVIDFLNPDPEQLSLDDIARGLSRAPRYAGQTEKPYTVIQHSLLVAHLAPAVHRLHALLHDAPEAYLCDVPSPAKGAMRAIAHLTGHQSPYDVIEHSIWKAVCRRWDLSPDMPEAVKRADHLAMVVEAPELQPLGWEHSVWDFARETLMPASAIQYLHGLLMEGPSLAVGRWLEGVATELAARRRAA